MAGPGHFGWERRGIGQRGGEGIHVGAVRDERSWSSAFQDADNPVTADAGADVKAERFQLRGHDA